MQFDPYIILAAFLAVVQLLLTMLPGVLYTRRGTTDTAFRRALSTLAFNLLLPCVVFVNVAGNLSADTIGSYWPFAANTTLSMGLGMALGWLVTEATGVPKHLRYHVIAASGFANLNSLPLMVTAAVCNQERMPFHEALGPRCTTVGFGYVALSLAVNQIVNFPIAKWLLKPRPPPATLATLLRQVTAASGRLVRRASSASFARVLSISPDAASRPAPDAVAPDPPPPPAVRHRTRRRSVTAPHAQTLGRHQQPEALPTTWAELKRQVTLALQETDELEGDGWSAPAEAGAAACTPHIARRFAAATLSAEVAETAAAAVPAAAAAAAAAAGAAAAAAAESNGTVGAKDVGAANVAKSSSTSSSSSRAAAPLGSHGVSGDVPAAVLQVGEEQEEEEGADQGGWHSKLRTGAILLWTFVRDNVAQPPTLSSIVSIGVGCVEPLKELFFPTASAPLGFVSGAAQTVEAAYVFVSSFILGSVMARGPGPGTRAMGVRACAAVCAVRFLVLPLVGAVIVVSSIRGGLFAPPDPVFAFLLLLQYCVPTANQVQYMASMWGNHEEEVGALIFWEYCVALVALPAWMVTYVWLLDRFELYPAPVVAS